MYHTWNKISSIIKLCIMLGKNARSGDSMMYLVIRWTCLTSNERIAVLSLLFSRAVCCFSYLFWVRSPKILCNCVIGSVRWKSVFLCRSLYPKEQQGPVESSSQIQFLLNLVSLVKPLLLPVYPQLPPPVCTAPGLATGGKPSMTEVLASPEMGPNGEEIVEVS